MKYKEFIILAKESEPSDKLKGIHLGIWYAMKIIGKWLIM